MKNYTKRSAIIKRFNSNIEKIKDLQSENIELNRQNLLLTDKNQRYEEKEEVIGYGKTKETVLVGRVYWKEFFKDEDYPNDPKKGFFVERNKAVRINGEWLNGL